MSFLMTSDATARHRKHYEPAKYTYGYYVAKGFLVPMPKPRENRVTPQEGKLLADYLLPITRINEAFNALESK
jgi:hypothetical protein